MGFMLKLMMIQGLQISALKLILPQEVQVKQSTNSSLAATCPATDKVCSFTPEHSNEWLKGATCQMQSTSPEMAGLSCRQFCESKVACLAVTYRHQKKLAMINGQVEFTSEVDTTTCFFHTGMYEASEVHLSSPTQVCGDEHWPVNVPDNRVYDKYVSMNFDAGLASEWWPAIHKAVPSATTFPLCFVCDLVRSSR